MNGNKCTTALPMVKYVYETVLFFGSFSQQHQAFQKLALIAIKG
jgi:hypothetical protein